MKKNTIRRILYIIAALLVALGVIFTVLDYRYYYFGDGQYMSAPFDLYVLVRVIEFILPAVILSVVGLIIRGNSE